MPYTSKPSIGEGIPAGGWGTQGCVAAASAAARRVRACSMMYDVVLSGAGGGERICSASAIERRRRRTLRLARRRCRRAMRGVLAGAANRASHDPRSRLGHGLQQAGATSSVASGEEPLLLRRWKSRMRNVLSLRGARGHLGQEEDVGKATGSSTLRALAHAGASSPL